MRRIPGLQELRRYISLKERYRSSGGGRSLSEAAEIMRKFAQEPRVFVTTVEEAEAVMGMIKEMGFEHWHATICFFVQRDDELKYRDILPLAEKECPVQVTFQWTNFTNPAQYL